MASTSVILRFPRLIRTVPGHSAVRTLVVPATRYVWSQVRLVEGLQCPYGRAVAGHTDQIYLAERAMDRAPLLAAIHLLLHQT
jgi:hypothetical protein